VCGRPLGSVRHTSTFNFRCIDPCFGVGTQPTGRRVSAASVLQCATQRYNIKVERATEQTACRSIREHRHLVQDRDSLILDYYRSALLLVARAEIKPTARALDMCFDIERRGKIPPGVSLAR
jgi:hypothetical protein